MALEVEDGTGKTNSESFISVAECASYLSARGNDTFGNLADDTLKEEALRRATRYLQTQYRGRWKGRRTDDEQALDWPRSWVIDRDGFGIDGDVIPQAIKDACCEAAHREAVSPGTLQPDLARGGAVNRSVEQVGSIRSELEYAPGAPRTTTFPVIDMLVSDLVEAKGVMRVSRS